MRPDAHTGAHPSPAEVVLNLSLSYLVSKSLHVAAELGIADLLSDGAKTIDQLASSSGTHRSSLLRLLRTLAAHGVFAEDEHGRVVNTPASALLQRGIMRDGVLLCGEVIGDGTWWQAIGGLRQSVMTGEPAFQKQQGMGFFDYLREHPNCSRWFDRGMANFAAAENPALAEAYDYAQFPHIVDVGGGQGGLLAEVLKRHPAVRGTLFDLPEVVANPACLNHESLSGRWTASGGDFSQAVPAGGDCYILKRILHDWSDEQCLRILRSCRAAMRQGARLLVIDAVIPAGNDSHPGKVMDILMMVLTEGRERTAQEFQELFHRANLKLNSITTTPSTLAIIEAIPA